MHIKELQACSILEDWILSFVYNNRKPFNILCTNIMYKYYVHVIMKC